jgi:phosphocarrier protein HPr
VPIAEATVEIKNRLGLHLRAASTLAQAAAQFGSQITIARGKNEVNAKSVTGLMMLGAGKGAKLKVRADGDDAREALKAVEALFEQRFGEE